MSPEPSEFQEVDTFNRPLRFVYGPDAKGADRNAESRVARRAAIGAAEAFWLALIAAASVLRLASGGLGSGLIDQSQKRTAAAMQIADK